MAALGRAMIEDGRKAWLIIAHHSGFSGGFLKVIIV
jgi:hypothetical protein